MPDLRHERFPDGHYAIFTLYQIRIKSALKARV